MSPLLWQQTGTNHCPPPSLLIGRHFRSSRIWSSDSSSLQQSPAVLTRWWVTSMEGANLPVTPRSRWPRTPALTRSLWRSDSTLDTSRRPRALWSWFSWWGFTPNKLDGSHFATQPSIVFPHDYDPVLHILLTAVADDLDMFRIGNVITLNDIVLHLNDPESTEVHWLSVWILTWAKAAQHGPIAVYSNTVVKWHNSALF